MGNYSYESDALDIHTQSITLTNFTGQDIYCRVGDKITGQSGESAKIRFILEIIDPNDCNIE